MNDMDVLSYVDRIVITNEIALMDLPECCKCDSRQKKENQQNLFIFYHGRHSYPRPQAATSSSLYFSKSSLHLRCQVWPLFAGPQSPGSGCQTWHKQRPGCY